MQRWYLPQQAELGEYQFDLKERTVSLSCYDCGCTIKTAEPTRTESHESNLTDDVSPCLCESNLPKAKACNSMRIAGKWAWLDSNKKPQQTDNKELTENTKKQEVHNPVHKLEVCHELKQIIIAWPRLSQQQKQAILMLSTFDFSKQ